jgi:hypothetical protein
LAPVEGCGVQCSVRTSNGTHSADELCVVNNRRCTPMGIGDHYDHNHGLDCIVVLCIEARISKGAFSPLIVPRRLIVGMQGRKCATSSSVSSTAREQLNFPVFALCLCCESSLEIYMRGFSRLVHPRLPIPPLSTDHTRNARAPTSPRSSG